jgi:hypothetical protein
MFQVGSFARFRNILYKNVLNGRVDSEVLNKLKLWFLESFSLSGSKPQYSDRANPCVETA